MPSIFTNIAARFRDLGRLVEAQVRASKAAEERRRVEGLLQKRLREKEVEAPKAETPPQPTIFSRISEQVKAAAQLPADFGVESPEVRRARIEAEGKARLEATKGVAAPVFEKAKEIAKEVLPGVVAIKESIEQRSLEPEKKFLREVAEKALTKEGMAHMVIGSLALGGKIPKKVEPKVKGVPTTPPAKPPILPPKPPIPPLGEPPPIQSTIKKLTQSIKEAVPVRKEQEILYSIERGKRVAKAATAGERVPGERGFFAQLKELKGPLPKAEFEAIRSKFSQQEVDSLFDAVEKANILTFEKVSAKTGLANLFEGAVPTKGEIDLLREIFPEEFINALLAKRPFGERFMNTLGQIFNVPRSMMASVDLSAPLRQGVFLVGRPKQFVPAFGNMFKYAFSEKAYQGLVQSIKARPTYGTMRKARLAITELGTQLSSREERIMSSLPERIPIIGRVVRGSNRAYTGFLNKLRADVFDDILRKAKVAGKELADREIEDIATFVNAATGRGSIGKLQGAAPILNAIFFSPRLVFSRLNLLNPRFYIALSPIARKEAIKSLLSFAGIAGSVLALAKLGGAEVGKDPRSSDFGKMKFGNTRYDILGGFQQYARLVGQLISGEIVSSTSGRTLTLGEGFKPLTRKDILLRFVESKESPIASFIASWLQGGTFMGRDFDVPAEVINRFIPMVIQDMYDLSQEQGIEKVAMGLPAVFGVGVQTYGRQELAFGESRLGEPTAQIRPVPEMADKIRELVLGQLPLGTSRGFSVESYFDQLSELPRDQAAKIFDKIAEANPELAEKISKVVRERELGVTVHDKDLKAKGVASGDRAIAVKKDLDKARTREEKAALWNDYVKKGVITKEVGHQLKMLLSE